MPLIILIAIGVGVFFFFNQEEKIDPSSRNYEAGYYDGSNETCYQVERAVPSVRDTLRQRGIC